MPDLSTLSPSLMIQGTFAVCLAAYFLGCGLGTLHRILIERRDARTIRSIQQGIARYDATMLATCEFQPARTGQTQGE
ncbi:hypothetical protein I6F11_04215 [Ensifer sp. NBAIM29]|nr:hypothetical protein [Ensifer sp. NBAIM29]